MGQPALDSISQFLRDLEAFRGEFESIHYQFLLYDNASDDYALYGRVVLEDLPVETFSTKIGQETAPCLFAEWRQSFPIALSQLVAELRAGAFEFPGSAKKIRLVGDTGQVQGEGMKWDYNQHVQFQETARTSHFDALRLYWSGQSPAGIAPQDMLLQAKAKAHKIGFRDLEELVRVRTGGDGFRVGDRSFIQIFAPVRAGIEKAEYRDDLLTVVIRAGKRIEWDNLSVNYQIVENDLESDSPFTPGPIEVISKDAYTEGRSLKLRLTQKVPKGAKARILLSYKEWATDNTLVNNQESHAAEHRPSFPSSKRNLADALRESGIASRVDTEAIREALARWTVMIGHKGSGKFVGSGFLLAGTNAVLSCDHVVEGPGELIVRFASMATSYQARVIPGPWRDKDLSVLVITEPIRVYGGGLRLSHVKDFAEGDDVWIAGFPDTEKFGGTPTISRGHVSGANAEYKGESGLIKLSGCAISKGMSGGPVLLQASGEIIGAITLKALKTEAMNIGFARSFDGIEASIFGSVL